MIKYQAYHYKLEKTITANFDDELSEMIEFEGWEGGDYNVSKIHICRGEGCESEETDECFDFYGITTGHYCHNCYENNYPYRKDRYPTIEHDGYGERLNDDY